MQVANFDVNSFQASGQREADKSLLVRFVNEPLENKAESKAQGRPIYKDTVCIDIKQPGNRSSSIFRPATQQDIDRFPEHYAAFKSRTSEDEKIVGTLLKEWSGIKRSQVEELTHFNIKTVEQLANVADNQIMKFMNGLELKQRAQRYIKHSEMSAPLEALTHENKELKKEVNELKKSLAEVVSMMKESKQGKRISRGDKKGLENADRMLE